MCTTIGFSYNNGQVFGRTLELGMVLDNKVLYIPKGKKKIKTSGEDISSKYKTLGSAFYDIASFGDGINEHGLMGSNNFFPGYASFSKNEKENMINTNTPNAFDYLLTSSKDIAEVKEEAKKLNLLAEMDGEAAMENHFFFMDAKGKTVVLEPKNGQLIAYDNPYGVLTNAPSFPWHTENLKNYINLRAENKKETLVNGNKIIQFGEGTGMLGLPGDFTPPSRFIRAAYYISNTNKEMERISAILQGFRILSQFDIPKGAIIDPDEGHTDETLYTSIMDTDKLSYHVKNHNHINLQNFYLDDFKDEAEIRFIELDKAMNI